MKKNNTQTNNNLTLPEPTISNPFAQIDFIFNQVADIKVSSRGNILDCLSFYKRVYLHATKNYSLELEQNKIFYVYEQWDGFALLKMQSFLNAYNTENSGKRISSSSVASYVYALNQVLRYAALHKFTNGEYIHRVACAPVRAETTNKSAYSDRELDDVNNWLKYKLNDINEFLSFGEYNRFWIDKACPTIPNELEWYDNNNLRWYFEEMMNCQASYRPSNKLDKNYYFYKQAVKYPGGYVKLIKDWKIKPITDLEIIMPLALKLSLELGLNSSSLWNLTIDCFQEKHFLTGAPCLQYYKARSNGHMEMHLNPYDKDLSIRLFKEDQAKVIKKTIDLLIKATASIREEASADISRLLFIFKKRVKNTSVDAHKNKWEVKRINDLISSVWCSTRSMEDGLKSDLGDKLQLTISRFRSTKITNMVRKGIDFFEIQQQFGHKSLITTINYIKRNNIEVQARKEIEIAIKNIYKNKLSQQLIQLDYYKEQESLSENVVYKGIVSDCLNVFDPPEEVKKAKNYHKAHACTRYNMCLFCPNMIIKRHHLPTLVVYQRQIKLALGQTAGELPNVHHYRRTLGVLDTILDPNKSEFPREDLVWAASAAECLDTFIDPVVYRAVI